MQCSKLLFMPLLPLLPKYFQIMFFQEKPITKCVVFFFIGLSSQKLILFCAIWKPLMDFIAHTHSLSHTDAVLPWNLFFCVSGTKTSGVMEGEREEGGTEGGGMRVKRSDRNYSSDSLSAERLSITALLSARRSVLLLAVAVAAPRLSCFALLPAAAAAAAHLSYPASLSIGAPTSQVGFKLKLPLLGSSCQPD